jgi:hypothetical protein
LVATDLDFDEVVQLFAEGGEKFVVGFKGLQVSGGRADLLFGARVEAVVESDFEDFRGIEVAGEDVGFGSESSGFDAA